MPFSAKISLLLTSAVFGLMQLSFVNTLPTAVALGGAVVAAVEEEEAAQHASEVSLQPEPQWHFGNLTKPSEFTDFVEFKNLTRTAKRIDNVNNVDEGRGKHHKKQKLLKQLYPLLITVILVKTVFLPLILKVLTAISTSSFIMAKIALAASGLLALKWIFADSGRERTQVEIVHLPSKSFGGGNLGYNTIDWSDLSWSGSNYVDVKTTPKQNLKYIPIKGGGTSSSSSSSNLFTSSYTGNKANGASNGYKYNFNAHLDGKPFL